jgi:xanthine dehydrogenase small subunit
MSSVGLYEQNANPTAENVKNELTGNLCRCTGYDAIIKAGCSVDTEGRQLLRDRYFDEKMHSELLSIQSQPVQMVFDHKNARYDAPVSLNDAVQLLKAEGTRLIAGSTDLGVQINKGRHTEQRILDLRLIESLYQCRDTETDLVIGARVTFAELRKHLQAHFPEYAQYMNLFASPQIRNVGTMVGNIANASPIADSTPYLLMSNARIGVIGPNGRREIPMTSFYLGYKTLAMAPDELIESVTLPKPHPNDFIRVFKISARRDLDIACVNLAASIRVEDNVIVACQLAFGGVGPVIIRTSALEEALIGQCLPTVSSTELLPLLRSLITPISDVRGSQQFRFTAAGNLFRKFISEAQVALTSSMVSQ